MAYRDKLRAKENLEKDIYRLLQDFTKKTGYHVSDIHLNKVRYQNSEGLIFSSIAGVEVEVTPQI